MGWWSEAAGRLDLALCWDESIEGDQLWGDLSANTLCAVLVHRSKVTCCGVDHGSAALLLNSCCLCTMVTRRSDLMALVTCYGACNPKPASAIPVFK